MKRYYKEENGVREWLGKVLKVDGRQIINPSEEQILSAGYVEYVEQVVVDETELLENLKNGKILQLYAYDESSAVNNCVIVRGGNEMQYWADKHERDALKSAIRDYISVGRAEYRLDLRNIGISIVIPCEQLLQMLALLEVYATDCYNKTTDHEFAIKSLTTKEDVKAYDFKVGYPEKLRFEL